MSIVYKSLIAAVITAFILIIEKHSGPKLAGAIGGIPIVFAISFVLVTMADKQPTQINDFLWGGVIGAVGGILFSLLLIFLNHKNINLYWLNFILAYGATIAFAYYFSKS